MIIPVFSIKELSNLTPDCQFGYGTFREKPTIPMSKMIRDKSVPSFWHLQSLTSRTADVKK